MAIDYAALKTEIQTDPAALGYQSSVTAKNDQGIADLINTVRNGATFQVNREPVTVAQFIAKIDPAEFSALTQLQVSRLQALFSGGTLDINEPNTQSNMTKIFPAAGATVANVTPFLKRQGSRAEVLFGNGTVVTSSDVSLALRGAK